MLSSVGPQNGFDVLNSLTIQDNVLFLEDLKVGLLCRYWSSCPADEFDG